MRIDFEVLNRENTLVPATDEQPTTNINLKAPHGDKGISQLFCNDVEVDPAKWSPTYTTNDVHISLRGLPIQHPDDELVFQGEMLTAEELQAIADQAAEEAAAKAAAEEQAEAEARAAREAEEAAAEEAATEEQANA